MIKRAPYIKTAPEAIKAFSSGAGYFENSSIEPRLGYLVQLRVSRINGCAYCVDLHANQLRREGETQRRIVCLVVWWEVPLYDERERAALEWTEAVTLIKDTHAPDSAYEAVSAEFPEKELIDLTLVIADMNFWNRIAISSRRLPWRRERGGTVAKPSCPYQEIQGKNSGALWRERCISGGCSFAPRLLYIRYGRAVFTSGAACAAGYLSRNH